jgi:hypothetical protein
MLWWMHWAEKHVSNALQGEHSEPEVNVAVMSSTIFEIAAEIEGNLRSGGRLVTKARRVAQDRHSYYAARVRRARYHNARGQGAKEPPGNTSSAKRGLWGRCEPR